MSDVARVIIPVPLWCPHCGLRHVDHERAHVPWHKRAHTTHRCQGCGMDWDVYVSGAPVDEPPTPEETEEASHE